MKPVGWILVGAGLAAGGYAVARKLAAPSAAEPYAPSASEVPLTVDYEVAVEKLVQHDNYRKELTRIEKELNLLTESQEAKH
jgi:hypothetical protein